MSKHNDDNGFRPTTSRRISGVRELPPSERPRERLASHGASRLSTIELLAFVLGSGHQHHSTLSVAQHALVPSGGSLRRIASEPLSVLTAITGIGKARAAIIHAALELGRTKSTVSRSMSSIRTAPRGAKRASVYRMDAGGSPSTEPTPHELK